ncbi:transposase [Actinomadura viridis]|uniref:transposase n=1 Tax=Actinomadura viridis TaxID=58110 RepID=UPI0036B943ED
MPTATARSSGVEVTSAEDGAGWLAFLRGLVARGPDQRPTGRLRLPRRAGRVVVSDFHAGLVEAIGSTLLGTGWQRCRTHYLRNLLTRVPKSTQP